MAEIKRISINGNYAEITIVHRERTINYQLKADDEGLILDAVPCDESGLLAVAQVPYDEHPDFDEEK